LNPKIKNFQFWQEGSHPLELTSNEFIEQKLDYIHNDPLKQALYQSRKNTFIALQTDYSGGKGLLDIVLI
jgi:hypothetical protein